MGAGFTEKHYKPKELAELWGWTPATIRKLFRNIEGVQHLPGPGIVLGSARQSYDSMRIPESIAIQVYERLKRKPVVVKVPRTKKPKKVVKLGLFKKGQAVAKEANSRPSSTSSLSGVHAA